jgi:hypothetical protein
VAVAAVSAVLAAAALAAAVQGEAGRFAICDLRFRIFGWKICFWQSFLQQQLLTGFHSFLK